MAEASPSAPQRPPPLNDLFLPGTTYENWPAFNWNQRRFFLKDARLAFGSIQYPHTAMDTYMTKAAKLIREETDWQDEYRGYFEASKTQLYPKHIAEAKFFDKAATIIVALALVAADKRPNVQVYEIVRIVPAFYFIDGLHAQRLRELDERARGAHGMEIAAALKVEPSASLEQLWSSYIGGPNAAHLLREMTYGFCLTLPLAEKALTFFQAFGDGFAVLHAGQNGSDPALGTKAAAPSIPPNYVR